MQTRTQRDVPVGIIARNAFARASLEALVAPWARSITSFDFAADQVEAAAGEFPAESVFLVDVGDDLSDSDQALVASVKARFYVIAIVGDLAPTRQESLLALSVDAVIGKTVAAENLGATLHLVRLGQRVYDSAVTTLGPWAVQDNSLPREIEALTEREVEVLRHLARGEMNKTIAAELGLSEGTVRVHTKSIMRKLDFNNRTSVAIWAVQNGLDE